MIGIRGTTRLAGVIGWPVAHSRSPLLHNFWCARHGVDGAYVPLPVRPGALETALRGLAGAGFRGVNLTIPHKEAAFSVVDRVSDVARRAGAVNTLVFHEGGEIEGTCTDGIGLLADLRAHGVEVTGRTLVLGAGGAARAVAAALLDMGGEVVLANRTRARAGGLCEALGGGSVVEWDGWERALGGFDLLINTTSLGMGGEGGAFDLSAASDGLIVSDIVYVPLRTPLLAAAEARGLKGVNGLGMLAHQARIGFEAWFGVMPEVDAEVMALLTASL